MEQNVNPWKTNLMNGLILGMIGIVYTLVIYFLDLTMNKLPSYAFLLVLIFILFYLLKSYRDNFLHGMISYGQALGAGVIIFFYYSIIMAVFSYLLYAIIDPDLTGIMIAATEEQLQQRGMAQSQIDAAMEIQAKIMKPAIMALISIFGNMFYGLIISLIVSAFVRKEGNPLIDTNAQ
jgi:hypothetical protein